MKTKNVLITGCASGFGRELVPLFLSEGWTVLASLRNAESRRELFQNEVQEYADRLKLLSLDVSNASERENIAHIITRECDGSLDCLINNAGYGLFGALEDLSEEQIRYQMEVNFFGSVLLSRSLLPYLRKAQGRIINFSSALGFSGMPLGSLYCASKFAIEGFTEALAYELRTQGVQVALVEPGGTRTKFGSNMVLGENSQNEASPYRSLTRGYQNFRKRLLSSKGTSSDEVLRTTLRLASMECMPLRARCGKDSKALYMTKKVLPESLTGFLLRKSYDRILFRDS